MKQYKWDRNLGKSVAVEHPKADPGTQVNGETVPAAAHTALMEALANVERELEARTTAVEALDKVLRVLPPEELKGCAEKAGVDVGRATSVDGILEKICRVSAPPEDKGGDST